MLGNTDKNYYFFLRRFLSFGSTIGDLFTRLSKSSLTPILATLSRLESLFFMLNYSLTLSKEMKEELEALQEDFVPDDPMETEIRDFFDSTKENYVYVSMLFYKALEHNRNFDNTKQ